MTPLDGMRIATLEARMSDALASLISRRGGEPICVPAVREAQMDCAADVAHLIDKLESNLLDIIVFQTGVGARALFREAEKQGRYDSLLDALHNITTVCRGPKPTAALKQAGVHISLGIHAPYTTHELIFALDSLSPCGKRIMVLQYGERNATLLSALRERSATVDDICLYEWLLPQDTTPMRTLIHQMLCGDIDIIAFTSQVQIRHLYRVAEAEGISQQTLSDALNTQTIVAVVGPTCAAALNAVGVTPDIQPTHPKMGHMVNTLVEYVESRSSQLSATR